MQSIPEKNPDDPLMAGAAAVRPGRMYATRAPSAAAEVVFDASLIVDQVDSAAERFGWAARGWRNSTSEMRDRLIRNLRHLRALSTFSGAG